ncbi:MAG: hypothetical protein ACKPE1_17045, partial [Dolichospermum sp.]
PQIRTAATRRHRRLIRLGNSFNARRYTQPRFRQRHYEAVSKSQLLPSLDVDLLMRCINTENHAQALREFRAGIKIIELT